MSEETTDLFDRPLLRRRRERLRDELPGVDFLLRRAAEDMDERLEMVLREFPLALDLGGGHGLLTRMLRRRETVGQVITTDHSPVLLEGARRAGATVLACDEEWLPFADQSFSLAVSLLSLHFVNDLPGALIQIRRALKPDGLFMAALPGGRTLNELRTSFMLAEEELLGGISPRIAPMAEVRDYGGLLQRTGFALPVADSDLVTVSYENPLKLMLELRRMAGGNVLVDRLRKPMSRRLLQRVAEIYVERFGVDGRVPATFEIIHLSGWAPDPSQQQPLKPGTAATPLGAALSACALPDEDSET